MHKLNIKSRFSRVLVTGATGVAGPALVNLLLEKGYCVRIFSRHCSGVDALPDSVERFQGNIIDPRAVSMALKGVDAVFHLAAKLHDTKGRCKGDQITLINVQGTKNLVDQARIAGVVRFVFFSTINVYGPSHQDQCFTETSPVCPQDCYARSKLEAERLVLARGTQDPDGFSPVVLRVAAVYGPRMKGNYKTLMRYLKQGGFVLLGDGKNLRTLVFDQDLAQAALLCLEHRDSHGQIYNVTDGAVHPFSHILCSMCRALGRKNLFLRISEKKVVWMLDRANRMFRFQRLAQVTRMVEKQTESLGVSGEKLQTVLGFMPVVDLDQGWRAVVGKER